MINIKTYLVGKVHIIADHIGTKLCKKICEIFNNIIIYRMFNITS